ncbi:hypothetical protein RYX36_001448 [Vicia faba]
MRTEVNGGKIEGEYTDEGSSKSLKEHEGFQTISLLSIWLEKTKEVETLLQRQRYVTTVHTEISEIILAKAITGISIYSFEASSE